MYRFALRPWWVVSHLVVVLIAVTFVSLGLWQLARLDETRTRNVQLAERLSQPAVPIEDLVPPGLVDVDEAVDRQVTVTGTYRADEQVLIRGRSLDDSPGSWVVVPMELDDGRVVAVNRGWVRNDGRHTAVPAENRKVPPGEITIVGLVHATHVRGTLGAIDPDEGVLQSMARIDIARLDQQVEGDLLPVWVQLSQAEPGAPDGSPRLLDLPVVNDEGPHLSYAAQWFIFTAIGLIGYPLILRRVARERQSRHGDGPGPDAHEPEAEPSSELRSDEQRLDAPTR